MGNISHRGTKTKMPEDLSSEAVPVGGRWHHVFKELEENDVPFNLAFSSQQKRLSKTAKCRFFSPLRHEEAVQDFVTRRPALGRTFKGFIQVGEEVSPDGSLHLHRVKANAQKTFIGRITLPFCEEPSLWLAVLFTPP